MEETVTGLECGGVDAANDRVKIPREKKKAEKGWENLSWLGI